MKCQISAAHGRRPPKVVAIAQRVLEGQTLCGESDSISSEPALASHKMDNVRVDALTNRSVAPFAGVQPRENALNRALGCDGSAVSSTCVTTKRPFVETPNHAPTAPRTSGHNPSSEHGADPTMPSSRTTNGRCDAIARLAHSSGAGGSIELTPFGAATKKLPQS